MVGWLLMMNDEFETLSRKLSWSISRYYPGIRLVTLRIVFSCHKSQKHFDFSMLIK
jgi:hypothetical protein